MDEKPNFSVLLILVVIVIGHAPSYVTSTKCKTQDTRRCTNYNMVQFPDFHAFIGETEFDEKCRAFKEVFKCVYEHIQSCPFRHRFAFDIQKTVIDQVCEIRKMDYKESQRCFLQTNLQERVNHCFKSIVVKNCSSTDLIGACVLNAVTSTDGCTFKDGNLMRSLADARARLIRDSLNCDKTSAPMLATISPTTIATSTISSTDTTPTVTTTRIKTPTTEVPRTETHQADIAGTTNDFPIKTAYFTSTTLLAKIVCNTSPVSGQPVSRQTVVIDNISSLPNATTQELVTGANPQAEGGNSNNTASILSNKFDTSMRFAYSIAAVIFALTF